MRLSGKLVGIALAMAPLVGCRARLPVDEWVGTVDGSVLAKASLKYYWRSKIKLAEDEVLQQLWRLDENLYALTSTGRLVAVEASTGAYKWDRQVGGPAQKIFAPCHADNVSLPMPIASPEGPEIKVPQPYDVVVINTLTYALVIDRDSGELLRKIEFPFAANTATSSDGTLLFVGSVKGWYYALILRNGLRRWAMATGDMISARPVAFDRNLYVASHDGKFYAVLPENEDDRHLWTQETDGPLTAEFVMDRRGCFVPSQDYKLYAYELNTGQELWTFRTQGPLMRPVQVGQRSVYQLAEKDRFYAIDLANGRKRWESTEVEAVLATAETRALAGVAHEDQPYVFAVSPDRHLLVIPEMLGEVEIRLPLTGLELFVPNTIKPVIYAGTSAGKLVCITPGSTRYLNAEALED